MAIGTPVAGTLAENASATSSLAVPYPATIAAGDQNAGSGLGTGKLALGLLKPEETANAESGAKASL